MPFPLPTFVLAAPLMILVQDALPRFDTDKGCRASLSAAQQGRMEACIRDENEAAAKMRSDWTSYPPANRAHCARLATLAGNPSYVEMLTCLEIARDTRSLPESIQRGPKK